jgi:HSP90 family molecular chaperone
VALQSQKSVTYRTHRNLLCPDFGTSITLHIKADEAEFLDEHRLRGIISKYSDHITVPIMMIIYITFFFLFF